MARFSKEAQQEQRSRGQLRDRLSEYGWAVQSLSEPDLGEDFLVHVYENGEATGLSALLQVKSTGDVGNIGKLQRKSKPDALRYPLEVKDLEHWENHISLVVLIVWDVRAQRGFWVTIPDVIADLDRTSRGWRKRTKVRVTVSVSNSTDDRGLALLRRAMVDYLGPALIAASSGQQTIKMAFPRTPDGEQALQACRNWLERGDPFTLDARYIAGVQGQLWRRLLDPKATLTSVAFGAPRSNALLRTSIEVEHDSDLLHLPYIDFKVVKDGSRQVTLSNEHQGIFPVFVLTVDKPQPGDEAVSVRFSYRTRSGEYSLQEGFDGARLALLLKLGSTVRFVERTGSAVFFERHVQMRVQSSEADIREDIALISKAIVVQRRISSFARLKFPGRPILPEEIEAIEKLYQVSRGMKIDGLLSITIEVSKGGVAQDEATSHGAPAPFSLDVVAPPMELWGARVPLGRVRMCAKEPALIAAQIRAQLIDVNDDRPVAVELREIAVEQEYIDWLDGKVPSPLDKSVRQGAM